MALMAQVGFLCIQISLLEPANRRAGAGLAVAVLTVAAVIGRVCARCVGLAPRSALGDGAVAARSSGSTACDDVDDETPARSSSPAPCSACRRQRDVASSSDHSTRIPRPRRFGLLIGLSTAIGQFTYAFGRVSSGIVRDGTGGYPAA